MILFVILANITIAIANCYVAYRLWRLKLSSQRISQGLINFERQVKSIFHPAPTHIEQVAIVTQHLRLTRQQWTLYLKQVKFMLQIMGWLFGNYRKLLTQ
ncbi:MAG: hypothetical protein HC796_11190 [Synechococcaceae cyanobacterium RL_1_2]|nr:hypothetical protein [Synechococcaceae cyanobacterium RL_1_2]